MPPIPSTPKPSFRRTGKTVFAGLGAFCLFALILLIFLDVLSRNLFNTPIPGALEVTEYWLMVPLVSVGIWWAGVGHEHVRVSMLTEILGRNALRLADTIVSLLSIAILLRMAWLGFGVAFESMADGEYAGAYKIVIWPVRFIAALGFLSFALVLVTHVYTFLAGAGPEAEVHEDHMESPEAL